MEKQFSPFLSSMKILPFRYAENVQHTRDNCPFRGHSEGNYIIIKNVPPRDNCPWQVTLRALSLGVK